MLAYGADDVGSAAMSKCRREAGIISIAGYDRPPKFIFAYREISACCRRPRYLAGYIRHIARRYGRYIAADIARPSALVWLMRSSTSLKPP